MLGGGRGVCAQGVELRFGKRRRFWRGQRGWLPNNVDVSMPLTYALEMVKMVSSMLCVFYNHEESSGWG